MAKDEAAKPAVPEIRALRSAIEFYGSGQGGRRMIGVLFTDWTPEEAYAAIAAAHVNRIVAGELAK